MIRLERLTAPEALPITQDRMATHLRLEGATEAELAAAQDYVHAAAREIEEHASIAILTTSIRLSREGWPTNGILELPIGPAPSLSATVTVEGEAFTGFEQFSGTRPCLRLTADWSEDLASGLIVATYAAGFGADASAVPADLAAAVADQAAALFDRRGAGHRREQWLSPHAARIAHRYRRVAA